MFKNNNDIVWDGGKTNGKLYVHNIYGGNKSIRSTNSSFTMDSFKITSIKNDKLGEFNFEEKFYNKNKQKATRNNNEFLNLKKFNQLDGKSGTGIGTLKL